MENTVQQKAYIKFGKYEALVSYPTNYNSCAQYPVFIGIPGGNQSKANTDFFENVYFTDKHLEKYFRVIPIADESFTYHSITKAEIVDFLNQIKITLGALCSDWIVTGTSNGGLAAFNFIAAMPLLFSGVIAMPGSLGTNEITSDWSHLTVVLAHGAKDSLEWKNATIQTNKILIEKNITSEIFLLQGAAHIIKKGYSLNALYNLYFKKLKNGTTKK